MREIRQSGSEGGAMQTNVSFLPLSTFYETVNLDVFVKSLILSS